MQAQPTKQLHTKDRDGFLVTEDAAEYLGIKKTTLEAWRCRGGGPRFVKLGRAVRYRQSDLDEFIETRTRSHTSEEVPS